MALPNYFPFKTRTYNASSTSSNTILSSAVISRSKLIGGFYTTSSVASQTAVGVVDVTVNGSTATGMGAITITTSTGNSATNLGGPTAVTYLKEGDVLATVASSVVGGTVTFITQEF